MFKRLFLYPSLLLAAVFVAGCSSYQETVDRAVQQTIEAQRMATAGAQPSTAATSTPLPASSTLSPAPTDDQGSNATPTPPEVTVESATDSEGADGKGTEQATGEVEATAQETPTELASTADYEPILSDVPPLDCEYDEFQDWDVCSANSEALGDWARVDEGFMTVRTMVIQPKDESPVMQWIIGYTGDKWAFTRGFIILYDGQRYVVEVDRTKEWYSDVFDSGFVFELSQVPIESIETLIDIVTSKEIQVRLVGEQQSIDKTLSDFERQLLLRALATYEQKGGKLPANRTKLLTLITKEESQVIPDVPTGDDAAAASAVMTGTSNAAMANLRSGPGMDSDVVGQAAQGTVLEIVAKSEDQNWYQLADGKWIAASLVDLPGDSPQSESAPIAAVPQIISRYPSTSVSLRPYDSPVNLGDYVHWYDCVSFAPPSEYPFEVKGATKLVFTMITYSSSYATDSIVMRLNSQSGELVSTIYEGPPFPERKTATVDIPPGIGAFTFFVEGPGCWTARITASN